MEEPCGELEMNAEKILVDYKNGHDRFKRS